MAGSGFRSIFVDATVVILCWDNTVHPVLCDRHVSFPFSLKWSAVSIYRTDMDWIGYSEGAWVCLARFGPPPPDVTTIYSRWHVV